MGHPNFLREDVGCVNRYLITQLYGARKRYL